MTKPLFSPRRRIQTSLGVCVLVALLLGQTAWGAEGARQPLLLKPKAASPGSAPTPAATYNPARVRGLLMAYHGTSKANLEAASTQVDTALRALMDDPRESMLVRRQAARALHWFPSEENFTFVGSRLGTASQGLQTRLLDTLGHYAKGREARVAELVASLLSSPHAPVRHAAISLAEKIGPSHLRGQMEQRLGTEPDDGVKREIQRVLAKP